MELIAPTSVSSTWMMTPMAEKAGLGTLKGFEDCDLTLKGSFLGGRSRFVRLMNHHS